MLPIFSFNSLRLLDKQSIAIISDATVIIKPSCLITPFTLLPKPITISLRALSFISITLLNIILLGSIPNELP